MEYNDYLKTLLGKEIIVVIEDGKRFEGLCKAISYNYLNIVFSEKGSGNLVIVRNVRFCKMINRTKQ